MSVLFFKEVKKAIANLNPHEVRETAERPVRIRLHSASEQGYSRMENFLTGPNFSPTKRTELAQILHRASNGAVFSAPTQAVSSAAPYDIEIYDENVPCPENAFCFSSYEPQRTVEAILKRYPDLGLPLARILQPFRKPVIDQVIQNISRENALFALATALPDIIPSLIEIPWALGEFASDTAFLTVNQLRMAFLIAAASDRPIGYAEQKTEIGSIIAGAFGWRALSRELVGKIPFGGGLLPKAALAYAGTYVAGLSLERYYRIGYAYTRAERKMAYSDAIDHGKKIATALLENFRKPHSA